MSARDLPMAVTRHSGHQRSDARRAVEAMLKSTPAGLGIAQVAEACGIEMDQARRLLANIAAAGDAHNAHAGMRGAALYVFGPAPRAVAATPEQRTTSWSNAGDYDARELQPYTGRPGAMRAFELPSLVNGERLPRTAPAIMGARPEVRR